MKYYSLLFFFLLSCNTTKENPIDTEVPKSKTDVLTPLSIGNTWINKTELLDSNGVVIDLKYDSSIVRKDTSINNITWFVINANGIARNGNDGFYIYDSIMGPLKMFQFPSEIGDSIKLQGTTNQYCKLLSKNDTIVTAGVTFLTYKYKFYYLQPMSLYYDGEQIYYYKPNIGLIKYENITTQTSSGKKIFWQRTILISYSIK